MKISNKRINTVKVVTPNKNDIKVIVQGQEPFKDETIRHTKFYNENTHSRCASRVLIEYVGGKAAFEPAVQWLIREKINLKIVDAVVIPFTGSGTEFLNVAPLIKGEVKNVVLNDINPSITNLLKIIRDDRTALIREVEKILKDKTIVLGDSAITLKEHKEYQRGLQHELNLLEKDNILGIRRAALFIVLMNTTYGGNYSWKDGCSKISIACDIKKYERSNVVEKIKMYSYFMSQFNVIIETMDFADLFKKYDDESSLFLIDAPYLKQDANVLVSTEVTYGFPDFPHQLCIDMTTQLKGQFIYHNYRNIAQEKIFSKFNHINMIEYHKPIHNAKSADGKKKMSVEIIYFSNKVEA